MWFHPKECDFFQSSLNILSPFFNFQRKSFKEWILSTQWIQISLQRSVLRFSFKKETLPFNLWGYKIHIGILKRFRTSMRNKPSVRNPLLSNKVHSSGALLSNYFLLILKRRRKSKYFQIIHNPKPLRDWHNGNP